MSLGGFRELTGGCTDSSTRTGIAPLPTTAARGKRNEFRSTPTDPPCRRTEFIPWGRSGGTADSQTKSERSHATLGRRQTGGNSPENRRRGDRSHPPEAPARDGGSGRPGHEAH